MRIWTELCIICFSLGILVAAESDHVDENKHDGEDEGDHAVAHKPHWAYRGEYYPANWWTLDERCKSTNPRQSPINIEPMTSVFEDDLTEINLIEHHSKYRKYGIVNNGHSVNIPIEHEVFVSGGGLPGKAYRVAGVHFHWGSNDNQGSEHTVDGARFPLEMHMVTYDTERHGTLLEAVFGDNSLAVLGTMFKISADDNPNLIPLLRGLRQVYDPKTEGKIRSFPVSRLLPDQTDKYFRYMGSLTTPPCAESVIWTLFLHTQSISSKQLDEFRELVEAHREDGSTEYIEDNWRPIQPIHARIVYRSFIFKSEMSKAIANYGALSAEEHNDATTQSIGALTFLALLLANLL